jgi:hypothetical protein
MSASPLSKSLHEQTDEYHCETVRLDIFWSAHEWDSSKPDGIVEK